MELFQKELKHEALLSYLELAGSEFFSCRNFSYLILPDLSHFHADDTGWDTIIGSCWGPAEWITCFPRILA